ncbi:MAG: hypothetical protein R3228_17355 [Halioglobus sp.]|nr:hypothetical protein [Halioglobus sp.]
MATQLKIARSSELPVPAQDLLPRLDMPGVNAEMWPLLVMTAPPEWRARPIVSWPAGGTLFTSWILLFGVLPLDRHVFALRAVDPGAGFSESSHSLINRVWAHDRTIVATASGCRVTDEVQFQCRVAPLAYLLRPVYRFVFWWRHRRLRKLYGVI